MQVKVVVNVDLGKMAGLGFRGGCCYGRPSVVHVFQKKGEGSETKTALRQCLRCS